MARTKALSLLQAAGTKADLKEIYGIVIDNVMKDTLSSGLKSQAYTGNPAAGSVEFKRFANSQAKTYGTARNAGKGDEITAPPVTVNIDTHKEIIEEVAKFDLDAFGVGSIMARRASNHIDTMVSDLDIAFFTTAVNAGTAVTPTGTTAIEKLEETILTLETVKNDYVRGIPRNMIVAIVSPAFYSEIRTSLDSLPNTNVDTVAEEFAMYHGVRVYNGLNLPTGVDALVMAQGSVAQPVVTNQYGEAEKIPLSNDFAVSLFYDYGVKALTPDLIFKIETVPSTLGELDVTSVVGTTAANDTIINVAPATPTTGNKFVYKLGTTYTTFAYDATLTTGWTEFDSADEIAAGTSTKITVAEVTADGRARKRGIAVLVKKA